MLVQNFLFTSESVTEGHPDKVADQISDAILDAILEKDPYARVACETLVNTGMILIAGEITTEARIDYPTIARGVVKEIGYNHSDLGFDYQTCAVLISIDRQSPDIAMGIDRDGEIGAGDQGLMFGYACDETPDFMPMPIWYAHKLAMRLAEVRKKGILPFLRPDGKTQVTIRYEMRKPVDVHTIVIAAQHDPTVTLKELREAIMEEVIKKVIAPEHLKPDTKIIINGTGRFVIGGPLADCGMTGRKIIVDTYGGRGHHGGGAFSGKDPTKVDRTPSYYGRYVAKNLVAAGVAKELEVQVAYAIGVPEPLAINVNTYGTETIPVEKILDIINKLFNFRPKHMIEYLNLRRPIFRKTACYGHFGRNEPEFTWEKLDMVEKIKELAGFDK
ncbi:methionine adenosyltransferase [Thermodesulfobacterium sp.]|jgi:S-adenosylmethionine synthetase|uniref:methionine adenosyltransferase n=1 Tax=Thermodesulfobacterium sp. TaxID=1965289 RepID=UPI00074A96AA|nr:methionine adenosyltransferase [Thermodesulfobacterium sp.]KUJ97948.1 MAG: S-adenosylmethionine synthase [Thermodesulfobacterium sp. 37_54]KUK19681.1 MAG: S-adenosylmethionine synthase [Thermodesulfobacterium commune]MBZ4682281.1 S-adenosylmethionine synthetase [Thermodesulfobacterium sp.]MDK2861355.1 S-adenosylmethionine synthetase [Thermodesulfobacterium sp.]HBT03569.1 methionine adenosyltransferase [Thermodesulfobacterium commune]